MKISENAVMVIVTIVIVAVAFAFFWMVQRHADALSGMRLHFPELF